MVVKLENKDLKISFLEKLESEAESLNTKHTYVLHKVNELQDRQKALNIELNQARESAEDTWEALQKARLKAAKTRRDVLIGKSEKLATSLKEYEEFRKKYDQEHSELSSFIKKEESFEKRCGNILAESSISENSTTNRARWIQRRNAHMLAIKELTKKLNDLNSYAKKRSDELDQLELETSFQVDFSKESLYQKDFSAYLDAKDVFEEAEARLSTIEEELSEVTSNLEKSCDEQSRLFEIRSSKQGEISVLKAEIEKMEQNPSEDN